MSVLCFVQNKKYGGSLFHAELCRVGCDLFVSDRRDTFAVAAVNPIAWFCQSCWSCAAHFSCNNSAATPAAPAAHDVNRTNFSARSSLVAIVACLRRLRRRRRRRRSRSRHFNGPAIHFNCA